MLSITHFTLYKLCFIKCRNTICVLHHRYQEYLTFNLKTTSETNPSNIQRRVKRPTNMFCIFSPLPPHCWRQSNTTDQAGCRRKWKSSKPTDDQALAGAPFAVSRPRIRFSAPFLLCCRGFFLFKRRKKKSFLYFFVCVFPALLLGIWICFAVFRKASNRIRHSLGNLGKTSFDPNSICVVNTLHVRLRFKVGGGKCCRIIFFISENGSVYGKCFGYIE